MSDVYITFLRKIYKNDNHLKGNKGCFGYVTRLTQHDRGGYKSEMLYYWGTESTLKLEKEVLPKIVVLE